MNAIERIIAAVSPGWAVSRASDRRVLAAYEAATPSRLRKSKADNASGDAVVGKSGAALRGYARQLEQNYDLAQGVLDTLVDRVVGPRGISWEPLPKNTDGTLHEDFAKELKKVWKEIAPTLNVTWDLDDVETERLAARTLFRDGEFLVQFLEGNIPGLDHGSIVPFSIELIESDLLPFDLNDEKKGITQGVERSAWLRPRAYHLLKQHPGGMSSRWDFNTKRVPAEKMLHPKIIGRLGQARGVSIFSSTIIRIEDLKDYEESERVAARVAAALTGFIKKGTPDLYNEPDDGNAQRMIHMQPGIIADGLKQGEDIGTIESNRPSALLTPFHSIMTRRVAAGTRTNFSSIAKEYNGNYSSRKQEQAEATVGYEGLTRFLVGKYSRPIKQRAIQVAIISGRLKLPPDLDISTLFDAEFRGPVVLSLDAEKDAKARREAERAGHKSAQQNIRDAGGDPEEVRSQNKSWREKNDKDGLVFTTDPKYDNLNMIEAPAQSGASSLKRNDNEDEDEEEDDDASSD